MGVPGKEFYSLFVEGEKVEEFLQSIEEKFGYKNKYVFMRC